MTPSSPSLPHPIERILGTGLKRLLQWGIPLSLAALLLPAPQGDGLFRYTLIHLTVICVWSIAVYLSSVGIAPDRGLSSLGRANRATQSPVVVLEFDVAPRLEMLGKPMPHGLKCASLGSRHKSRHPVGTNEV